MEMTLRWYGPGYDSVKIENIRQIAGVKGVITTLFGKQAGEEWTRDEVKALKAAAEAHALKISGIESVNISDDIKAAMPKRDEHIENYIKSLEALGQEGIDMVCYNFMPVFDWTRSDLAKMRPDGSTVLSYDQSIIDSIDPTDIFASMEKKAGGFTLPGWEPERLGRISELFKVYKDVDTDKLFENHKYFMSAILPTLQKYNIKMAIHPDDPSWPVFGLPRIITDLENINRMLKQVDDPLNGVTLCTGSLGSNPKNDIPAIIRALKGRIHFAHVRNLIHHAPGKFDEAAHLSADGSMDMYEIMKALYDIGFTGPVRPDHGRMVWGETAMPGYGLYDRAMGAAYLQGLVEAIEKNGRN
jgi:D-mannonate dehydratase